MKPSSCLTIIWAILVVVLLWYLSEHPYRNPLIQVIAYFASIVVSGLIIAILGSIADYLKRR